MAGLHGRRTVVKVLTELMLNGQTVLLYGPMGIGKTAIMEAVGRSVKKQKRPCGFARRTRSLSEMTEALLAAYPNAQRDGRTQRQIRGDLSDAIEDQPGVLLLDHLHDAGTQFKGYLRSLQGTGLGVLLAADVEVPRDHARFRSMRLAYREMEVPPLPSRYMHCILMNSLSEKTLPNSLKDADRSALVKVAHGRPG
jgi:Cdc6-like AAA superfamily ATPase